MHASPTGTPIAEHAPATPRLGTTDPTAAPEDPVNRCPLDSRLDRGDDKRTERTLDEQLLARPVRLDRPESPRDADLFRPRLRLVS